MIPTQNVITPDTITVKDMSVGITMARGMNADTTTVKVSTAAIRKATRAAAVITASKQKNNIVLEPKYSRLRFPAL